MTTGQKVVCVDDHFLDVIARLYDQLPVKGKTYTIRAVTLRRETIVGSHSATPALLLNELRNPPDPSHVGGEELAFKPERFRALEELAERAVVSKPEQVPIHIVG